MRNLSTYCLLLFPWILSSQTLKETTKFFNNGQPMFVDYKDSETLKKVKTDIFNESGTLIFSVNFNEDGKMDGEFYDLINKGFYKNGELNCYDCMLVSSNNPNVFSYNWDKQDTELIYADIIKGRFSGKVVKKRRYEVTRNFIDWEASRTAVSQGAPVWYREVRTLNTGDFKEYVVYTANYSENGLLDDVINYIDGEVYVDNGVTRGFVIRDRNGIRDSIFNKNKILKVDYEFIKNEGYIIFSNPLGMEFKKYFSYKNKPRYGSKGDQTKLILVTGARKTELDNNGLYTNIAKQNFLSDILSIGADLGFDDYGNLVAEKNNFLYKSYNAIINGTNDRIAFGQREARTGKGLGFRLQDFSNKLSQPSEQNQFKKYLNENFSDEKLFYELRVNDVFLQIIRADDYFKAIKESFESGVNNFLELVIYNESAEKFDIIDIDDLISKAELYQREIQDSYKLTLENNKKEKSKQLLSIEEEILDKGFKLNSLVEDKYIKKVLKQWGRKNDIGYNITKIKVMDFKINDVNNLDIKFCNNKSDHEQYCTSSKIKLLINHANGPAWRWDLGDGDVYWSISGGDKIQISNQQLVYKSDIELIIKKFNPQITEYTFDTLQDLKNYEQNHPNDILKTDYNNLKLIYNLEWK